MSDRTSRGGRPDGAPTDAPAIWDRAATAFSAWRSGVPGAMDELVLTMTPILWHVVRSYGLTTEQTHDVIQTTWLSAVRRSGSIADPKAIAAWLITTARREAWRVSKHTSAAIPVTDEMLEYVSGSAPSAETIAIADDDDNRLWACVRTLSERCQRLLRIVAFDERPDYARIATDLDIPIGSIGPTRGRCLGKLRDVLAREGMTR